MSDVKLDVKSAKLISITRTKNNLDIIKNVKGYRGQNRLYHFSIESEDNKKYYPLYLVERVNKKTISLVCNHKPKGSEPNSARKSCKARISLKIDFETEEIPTDSLRARFHVGTFRPQ